MKVILLMYDTLNRRFLPPYGNPWVQAPNFHRLAERSVTFLRAYVGSMPTIPARRELHTGRLNFMHRSWGPLELTIPARDPAPAWCTAIPSRQLSLLGGRRPPITSAIPPG